MSGVLKSLLFLGLAAILWSFVGLQSPAFAQIDVTPRLKPSLMAAKAKSESLAKVLQVSSVKNLVVKTDDSVPFPRLAPHLTQKKRTKPVIYIDAGHGGRDPGAIGVKGTQEKKIVFKASSTLKTMLEKTGRYKVVLTRPSDIYLDHELRLRLAREGGADLFISVHADSAGNKNAQGASVYTLADRAKGRSKRLVSGSQNWIMDVDLSKQSDPVGDILVDLAQRKTKSQSEQFADILITQLGKSTKLVGNSHRRAGYFVLLAPDVPAVLLELGFLSNAADEKLLNKASHREKIMRSVVRSINLYFEQNK